MEAQAYANWMRGNWTLEKADHQTACVNYGVALTLCHVLANRGHMNDSFVGANANTDITTDAASLEMRDYFTARTENVIDPLLRFCQYELRVRNFNSFFLFTAPTILLHMYDHQHAHLTSFHPHDCF